MVSQTSHLDDEHSGPVSRLTNRIRSLSGDVLYLLELQSHLFQADFKNSRANIVTMVLAGATAISTGSVGVLILSTGLAYLIHESLQLPVWLAFAIVGLVLLVITVSSCVVLYRASVRNSTAFENSKVELQRNLEWVRSNILKSTT